MTDKHYWKIPADKAAPIIADDKRAGETLLATLSDLAGVPVHNASRAGNMAFGWAHITAIQAHEAPAKPGWKPKPGEPGSYVPNRRTNAGKANEAALDKLDCLGLMSALQRGGVTPWWKAPKNDFRGAAAGAGIVGDVILLVTSAEHDYGWPEWVERIKASEFYALQEAQQEATP